MNICHAIQEIATTLIQPASEEPTRFLVTPGDFVCIEPDFIVNGDIPLRDSTTHQILEQEAFTGKSRAQVTGWIRKGQIALVISVVDDEAYLWCRDHGRGWIDRLAVCRIQDIPPPPDQGNNPGDVQALTWAA